MLIKLTQQFINNQLRCSEGRSRISFYHSDLKSFYLEVRATSPGQGTFYFQFRDPEGKTRHQKLGRTTEITLSEAMKQAKILQAEIALGRNSTKQAVMTYEQFFEHHYVPHKSPHKRSISDDIRIFRLKIYPTLGHKLLHQITRIEIQALLTSYRQTMAPASCNHILKVIKHSLNLAVE